METEEQKREIERLERQLRLMNMSLKHEDRRLAQMEDQTDAILTRVEKIYEQVDQIRRPRRAKSSREEPMVRSAHEAMQRYAQLGHQMARSPGAVFEATGHGPYQGWIRLGELDWYCIHQHPTRKSAITCAESGGETERG